MWGTEVTRTENIYVTFLAVHLLIGLVLTVWTIAALVKQRSALVSERRKFRTCRG